MQPTTTPPIRRGVVGILVRDGRLLVIRRAAGVVAPLTYCFPGGGIEQDESEPVALAREMWEELGVDVRPAQLLWRSQTPWHVELAWWLAALEPTAELKPNPAEVHSCAWYTAAEVLALEPLLESSRQFLTAWADGQLTLDLDGANEADGTGD